MLFSYRFFWFFFIFTVYASCETIQTFYGPIEINEPVLIEIIHSSAMQRLKRVHQYGVAYYTKNHPEEYSRFDHSLGVWAILRLKNASLEEQIAGLLHDVSHTAFSHVGDWVYGKEHEEEDYQTSIHDLHLMRSGIEKILNRHGYKIKQVSPKRTEFLMLEQPLPNLCADRLDYNIQGAYFKNLMTKEEALELLRDLSFENKTWVLTQRELAAKLMHFSIYMTENCWGSAENYMTSKWLADAISMGIKAGIISWDDFHLGDDQTIWNQLSASKEPLIQKQMKMLSCPNQYYCLVDPKEADSFIKFKCRGVDPWIKENGRTVRLSSIDPTLNQMLEKVKQRSLDGWPIKYRSNR